MIITGAISAPIRRQCSACLEDHVAAGVLRWDAVSWALAATTLLASASAAVRLSASPIPPSPSFVMFHLTRSSVPQRRERGTGPSPPSCTTPSPFTGVTTGSLPRSLDVLIRSLPAMPLPHTTRAAVIRDTSLRPHGRTTAFSLRTIAEDRVLHVLPLWMRGPRAAPGWWCHGRRRSQLPRKTCSFFNPGAAPLALLPNLLLHITPLPFP